MRIKSQHIDEEPQVTTAETARYFSVSVATINSWRSDGMPCIKYNSRMFRYKLSEVKRWLKDREDKRVAQKATEVTK